MQVARSPTSPNLYIVCKPAEALTRALFFYILFFSHADAVVKTYIVALNALPPTIMCRWEDGRAPGWAAGSSRWVVRVEQGKRRPAWACVRKAANATRDRVNDFILADSRGIRAQNKRSIQQYGVGNGPKE